MNTLTFNEDFKSAYGKFASLDFALDLELQAIDANWDGGKMPEATANGAGRPAYDVFGVGRAGPAKIGAAWVKPIKRGDSAGQKMISLSLDDPSFPTALHLSAFPGRAKGEFDVKWERPRRADNAQ